LLMLWAAVCIYGVLRRDRTVQLMAFWVIIVPLPLAFLLPIRGGGSLYLLLFGWAMIFAKVAYDLAVLVSKALGQWIGLDSSTKATNGSHGGNATRRVPVKGMLGVAVGKIPVSVIRIAVIAALAFSFAIFTEWENRRLGTARALLGVGQNVKHVIGALESLNLRPAPGSTVLLDVQEQPFQNKWHPLFIASLIWNDHSLQIWITGLTKVTPEELAKADYLISLTEFQAQVIRSPTAHHSE